MIKESEKLFHLIKLMDDESLKVQEKVHFELKQWGRSLREKINGLSMELSVSQRRALEKIELDFLIPEIKANWPKIFEQSDDSTRLENAFACIADYQNDYILDANIFVMLEQLKQKFIQSNSTLDAISLANFLFIQEKYRGNVNDYYNPKNSNLAFVIREKVGIPITLSCLYILLGRRLGIKISGCNIPGHFFTRINHNDQTLFVDCFNNGRIMDKQELSKLKIFNMEKVDFFLYNSAPTNVIITRIIRNLIHAYKQKDQIEKATFFKNILHQTLNVRFKKSTKAI